MDKILAVYGKAQRKLFYVRWEGYNSDEDSWVTEHSLLADGCKDAIDEFWLRTDINPAQDFFADRIPTPAAVAYRAAMHNKKSAKARSKASCEKRGKLLTYRHCDRAT